MKCAYFKRQCIDEKHTCGICMMHEIDYLRKKVADLESKDNVKEGSINITREELVYAEAEVLANMVAHMPALSILHNEFVGYSALLVKKLFDKEEK